MGDRTFQITSQVSLTIFGTVVLPRRKDHDNDCCDSPDARYFKVTASLVLAGTDSRNRVFPWKYVARHDVRERRNSLVTSCNT